MWGCAWTLLIAYPVLFCISFPYAFLYVLLPAIVQFPTTFTYHLFSIIQSVAQSFMSCWSTPCLPPADHGPSLCYPCCCFITFDLCPMSELDFCLADLVLCLLPQVNCIFEFLSLLKFWSLPEGAISVRALRVSEIKLKSIRIEMGSQCSVAQTGIVCSLFLVFVKSLAAGSVLNVLQFSHQLLSAITIVQPRGPHDCCDSQFLKSPFYGPLCLTVCHHWLLTHSS